MRYPLIIVPVAAALLLGVAGCGGSDDTPQGTAKGVDAKALGTAVSVQGKNYGDDSVATLEVTPTSVQPGKVEDLPESTRNIAQGKTLYYVTATYKNTQSTAFDVSSVANTGIELIDGSGARAGSVGVAGGFPACPDNLTKSLAPGQSVTSCTMMGFPTGGGTPAQVAWTGPESSYTALWKVS